MNARLRFPSIKVSQKTGRPPARPLTRAAESTRAVKLYENSLCELLCSIPWISLPVIAPMMATWSRVHHRHREFSVTGVR